MTAEALRQVVDVLQYFVLSLSVVTLALSLEVARKRRDWLGFMYGPISLTAHATLFYVLVLSDVIPPLWGNLWSVVLRLHSAVIFFLAVVFLLMVGDKKA